MTWSTISPLPSSVALIGSNTASMRLTDPGAFDGFTSHDLISGLHGVCVAIDSAIVDGTEFENHHATMCGLAQAAKVLSAILNTQMHS